LQLNIGIDDTDSPEGGCTTYLAALLLKKLEELGAKLVDYPLLIRLNPNAPWKTRGNGAVCLRLELPENYLEKAQQMTIQLVEEQGEFQCGNTNPGAVFHIGIVSNDLAYFYERVLCTIVRQDEAENLLHKHFINSVGWKNKRGLIGALASIGANLNGDHTYELLTYRIPENRGKKRLINSESVYKMDQALKKITFSNVDPETNQILITPRGPDPVLYGVRGESPEAVYSAYKMIISDEPIERWVIFRTNQGTDAHLVYHYKIKDLKICYPSIIVGDVSEQPKTIEGGHVIFKIKDSTGILDCSAYEPSGRFRDIVNSLMVGDSVQVAGGIRELESGITLNLEKLEVINLIDDFRIVNPRCPICGGGTESMGMGQGLRCRKCGYKSKDLVKTKEKVERALKPGIYLPPLRAERHLTKPYSRYGRERNYISAPLYNPWRS